VELGEVRETARIREPRGLMQHDAERRVLILCHCYAPNVGGVETHLSDLTGALVKRGVRADVLTYQPLITRARGPRLERRGCVTIRRLPWIGFGLFNKLEPHPALQFLYLFPALAAAAFLYMLVNARRVRAVHAHGMVCSVIGRLLKAVFGCRLVVSVHAVYGWLYELAGGGLLPRFLAWTLRGADQVLCLSEASRREILRLGLADDRVGTFTYWIDQERFKPMDKAACRQATGIPDRFTVLFVGRLIPVKGVELLLEVARQLPDVQFAFAGDGPLQERLAQAARQMPNVVFVGKVPNESLPPYYNAADLLCVPSQYEEGFGRILIEALACGCPVVASNRGGIPEAVDSTVGVLVDPPTAGNFRDVIAGLRADRARLEALRRNSRPYAERRFSERNAGWIVASYDG